MKLYDGIIKEVMALTEGKHITQMDVQKSHWPMVEDNRMILRSDMAYELGAQKYYGLGATLLTSDKDLLPENFVRVIGCDLSEIKEDHNYARITIVRVKEEGMGEGNALYSAIRNLEYTRYHFYPEGFMMRVSSSQNKESVRISKDAIKQKISFADTGNRMIEAFFEHKLVEAVGIYYVTDSEFDYKSFEKLTKQGEDITRTIDHILKDVKMDCNICNLQEICSEVEGLRELHFANSTQ